MELCVVPVKCFAIILSWSRCTKQAKCTFACLARMVFTHRKRMKDLLLLAHVVVRTSKTKISRLHLADYVKKLHQKACRTCSRIICPHSTNQIIDLQSCRCHCRRYLLNPLMEHVSSAEHDRLNWPSFQNRVVRLQQEQLPVRKNCEGLPGVLGNKGTLAKYRWEDEPIFREQWNKTLQIRGRKNRKQIN